MTDDKTKRIIYLTYTRPDYSLNATVIKGLRENGIEVLDFHVKSRGISGFLEALSFYRHNSKNIDLIMIGCDSPALAIFIRFFFWKKIIYNAVLSNYERMIISRELAPALSLKAVYYWLLDFMAVDFADLTMVESDKQADFFEKLFSISRKKLFRSYIGVDEDNFYYESSVVKFPEFTVVFRGALMPEAGAEYVVQAAKILENENIKFIMQSGGMLLEEVKHLIEELKPKNLELSSNLLPYPELRKLMQECHLSLGQMSDHPRLLRTIPHKAYETLIMRLPYLTASNKGILELLKSGETCITCEPANAKSLAEKILWAKNNPQELDRIAKNGYEFYVSSLTPRIISRRLLDKISGI